MTAMATAKETEHHPALAFAFFIGAMACNRQRIDGAVSVCHSTFGIGQCCGTEDHIDHAQDGFGVTTHGTWTLCTDHQAIGNDEIDGIKHTRIGGYIRKDVLQGHITSRYGSRFGNVHRAGTLRRRARKIQGQAITLDGHVQGNGEWCVDHTIVVQQVFEAVATVGQAGNVRTHQAYCTRAQLHHGLGHFAIAIFIEQTIQTLGTQFEGGQLTIQVAPEAVGQAGVGAQNGQHIFVQHTSTQNANGRNLHRLLPALGGCRVVVARYSAAHIVPMRR